MKVWTFLYEVMRRRPMADLFRLQIDSLSATAAALTDIEATPTFLFTSELFNDEAVRKMIDEIDGTESTTSTLGTPQIQSNLQTSQIRNGS
jgi:hypothetical protein